MSAHIVRDKVPPGTEMPEQIHNMLGFIIRRGDEMQRIIRDFLDFQAMQDGSLSLEVSPINLNDIAKHVIEANADYATSKEINLMSELDSSLPEIRADSARLS